jgi:hypothetical protein
MFFGWLYRHQSVARASFVDQQNVPRAGEVGLGRDAVLTPYIPSLFILLVFIEQYHQYSEYHLHGNHNTNRSFCNF